MVRLLGGAGRPLLALGGTNEAGGATVHLDRGARTRAWVLRGRGASLLRASFAGGGRATDHRRLTHRHLDGVELLGEDGDDLVSVETARIAILLRRDAYALVRFLVARLTCRQGWPRRRSRKRTFPGGRSAAGGRAVDRVPAMVGQRATASGAGSVRHQEPPRGSVRTSSPSANPRVIEGRSVGATWPRGVQVSPQSGPYSGP